MRGAFQFSRHARAPMDGVEFPRQNCKGHDRYCDVLHPKEATDRFPQAAAAIKESEHDRKQSKQ